LIVGVEHPTRLRHSSALPSASRTFPQTKVKECTSTSTTTTQHYVLFDEKITGKLDFEKQHLPPDSFPAVLHPPANASHPPGREIRLLLEKLWDCRPRPSNPTLRDLICGMKETTTYRLAVSLLGIY
jgi:hypothetical protein